MFFENDLSSADLSVSGKLNRAGSVACRKSRKPANYRAEDVTARENERYEDEA